MQLWAEGETKKAAERKDRKCYLLDYDDDDDDDFVVAARCSQLCWRGYRR